MLMGWRLGSTPSPRKRGDFGIAPDMRGRPVVTRCRGGRSSAAKAKGSAFSGRDFAIGADDLEFVGAALANVGHENLPDPDILRRRMT